MYTESGYLNGGFPLHWQMKDFLLYTNNKQVYSKSKENLERYGWVCVCVWGGDLHHIHHSSLVLVHLIYFAAREREELNSGRMSLRFFKILNRLLAKC